MLDRKFIRSNADLVKTAAARKLMPVDIDKLLSLDSEWRTRLRRLEELRSKHNSINQEIGKVLREGGDATELIRGMKVLAAEIEAEEAEVSRLEREIRDIEIWVPNIPHETVPVGNSSADNLEVRRWGRPREFEFDVKPHWEIASDLDIIDFQRGSKMSGSRFVVYKGAGALLERALINFMLDVHTREHGYTEIFPPFLVTRESMFTTGQIPKLEEDMFKVRDTDLYLIPTAEVPLTNLYKDEIMSADDLPAYFVAYSACFRAEAGAHGRDTRGLIRVHQFNKVELMKFTTPETSYEELEKLVRDAEDILQRLELPYRVVVLCTGDMSFASAKTYDIEVWLPSYGEYKEISSCSNFEEFQARRGNIRFRRQPRGRVEYVNTLNGSGLAVGRTVAAILENYQEPDGSVVIPRAIRPYMGGMERIEAQKV